MSAPLFGQIVIGPPGSGKTTYCFAMKEYYDYFGRKTLMVNLDPANESNLQFDIDIRELIDLSEVEREMSLGPNSSFLYCFNFLEKNIQWLRDKILQTGKSYIIFDTPGQIEIFTLSKSFKNICRYLTNEKTGMNIRLCAVNLIESSNLCDIPRYIFSIFSVLNAMINLELPQVNVISKIDLLKTFGEIPFPLSFYKNPNDSEQLLGYLNECNINPRMKSLNKKIAEFVSDYGLVAFDVLDIKNQKHLNRISSLVDKANGYIYLDTGSLQEEQYIEIRNQIARNEEDFDDDDDEYRYSGD